MKVVILCGGMGTRLREETEYRPKPMVRIGSKPILWHIMKIYAHYGFNEFILCLGYKGNTIKEYFLNYEAMNNDFTIQLGRNNHNITYHTEHEEQNFTVTLADTGDEANTGSRIAQVARYIDGDNFMVTYGDGLSDVNIQSLVNFHQQHGRTATMMTYRPISRYGKLELDDKGNVSKFLEKPQVEDWVSGGFFVFKGTIFDYLSTDYDCVMETTPLARAVSDGELIGYRHDGFFYAMDTYKEHLYLNSLWNSGKAPWKIW